MNRFLYRAAAALLAVLALWCAAALYIDCRIAWLKLPISAAFVCAVALAFILSRRSRVFILLLALVEAAAMAWWLSLNPSNGGEWQRDVVRMSYAEIEGDHLTVHNIRSCDYRTEDDYNCDWLTRDFSFSSVRHVDVFLIHWGAPLIAHVIVSFDFANGQHLSFSIEARKRKGQSYSALLGFFRQYGLIYLAPVEQDVVRLRTNFRTGECVYLYRTRTTAADARGLLLQYVQWMNETKRHAKWYNALTENCDRSLIRYLANRHIGGIKWWDWRGFLNGHGDGMLYDLGDLVDDGLSFPSLRDQALINGVAKHTQSDAGFSAAIREKRAGFHE